MNTNNIPLSPYSLQFYYKLQFCDHLVILLTKFRNTKDSLLKFKRNNFVKLPYSKVWVCTSSFYKMVKTWLFKYY